MTSAQETQTEVLFVQRASLTDKNRHIVNEYNELVYTKKSTKFTVLKSLVEYGTNRELWHHAGKQDFTHERTWINPEEVTLVQVVDHKLFVTAQYQFRYMDQDYCWVKKGIFSLKFDCIRDGDDRLVATFEHHMIGKFFGTFHYLPDLNSPEELKSLLLVTIIDIVEVL
ncbi:hypothetical protein IWQ61_007277 [Dispira simplex]|nr:hypothetical protein IWQ61_007277 [Dispira simplex]